FGTCIQYTFHIYFFIVRLHNMLYDGQSQPRAPFFPATALIYPIEPLKDPGQLLFGDTLPIVRYPDNDLTLNHILLVDFRSSISLSTLSEVCRLLGDYLLYLLPIGPDMYRYIIHLMTSHGYILLGGLLFRVF